MNPTIVQILLFAIPAIIAITLHEAAHGYTANFSVMTQQSAPGA